jgi:hypothetical protein
MGFTFIFIEAPRWVGVSAIALWVIEAHVYAETGLSSTAARRLHRARRAPGSTVLASVVAGVVRSLMTVTARTWVAAILPRTFAAGGKRDDKYTDASQLGG